MEYTVSVLEELKECGCVAFEHTAVQQDFFIVTKCVSLYISTERTITSSNWIALYIEKFQLSAL